MSWHSASVILTMRNDGLLVVFVFGALFCVLDMVNRRVLDMDSEQQVLLHIKGGRAPASNWTASRRGTEAPWNCSATRELYLPELPVRGGYLMMHDTYGGLNNRLEAFSGALVLSVLSGFQKIGVRGKWPQFIEDNIDVDWLECATGIEVVAGGPCAHGCHSVHAMDVFYLWRQHWRALDLNISTGVRWHEAQLFALGHWVLPKKGARERASDLRNSTTSMVVGVHQRSLEQSCLARNHHDYCMAEHLQGARETVGQMSCHYDAKTIDAVLRLNWSGLPPPQTMRIALASDEQDARIFRDVRAKERLLPVPFTDMVSIMWLLVLADVHIANAASTVDVNVVSWRAALWMRQSERWLGTIDPSERSFPTTCFGELFRMLSHREVGSAAMLSRAVAGIRGRRVLFSIPGAPAAVRLAVRELILPELGHLIAQLDGT